MRGPAVGRPRRKVALTPKRPRCVLGGGERGGATVDEQQRRKREGVDRRAWLAGALAAGWLGGGRARGDEPPGPAGDERRDEELVREAARKAGLKAVGATRSAHYLAVGDAPEGFRALTLRDCE